MSLHATAQGTEVVATLQEQQAAAGRRQHEKVTHDVGVVAGGEAEVGDGVGPVGVEPDRQQQPGGGEPLHHRRHHLGHPLAVAVAR